jgi:hypothetical protein
VRAARWPPPAEKLQFTLGDGPCLQALGNGVAVVATAEQIAARWPPFSAQLAANSSYRSVVSLPIQVATKASGAIDLYLTDPVGAVDVSIDDAAVVARQVSAALALGAQISPSVPERPGPSWLYGPLPQNRMMVWVALGMLTTRENLDVTAALALLRAYAYAHDQLVDDVATALVYKTLPFRQLEL